MRFHGPPFAADCVRCLRQAGMGCVCRGERPPTWLAGAAGASVLCCRVGGGLRRPVHAHRRGLTSHAHVCGAFPHVVAARAGFPRLCARARRGLRMQLRVRLRVAMWPKSPSETRHTRIAHGTGPLPVFLPSPAHEARPCCDAATNNVVCGARSHARTADEPSHAACSAARQQSDAWA